MLLNQSTNQKEKQLWAIDDKYADVCKVPDIKKLSEHELAFNR